jgi:hypothetical protein
MTTARLRNVTFCLRISSSKRDPPYIEPAVDAGAATRDLGSIVPSLIGMHDESSWRGSPARLDGSGHTKLSKKSWPAASLLQPAKPTANNEYARCSAHGIAANFSVAPSHRLTSRRKTIAADVLVAESYPESTPSQPAMRGYVFDERSPPAATPQLGGRPQ